MLSTTASLVLMLNLTSTNLLTIFYMDNVKLQNISRSRTNISPIILWFGNKSQRPVKNNVFRKPTHLWQSYI